MMSCGAIQRNDELAQRAWHEAYFAAQPVRQRRAYLIDPRLQKTAGPTHFALTDRQY